MAIPLKELLRRTLVRISGKENVSAQAYLEAFREEARNAGIVLEDGNNLKEQINKLKPNLQTLIKKYPIKNQEELIVALTSLLNSASQLNDKAMNAQKELIKALLYALIASQDKNFATLANTQLSNIDKATPSVLSQWNQKWHEILEQKKKQPISQKADTQQGFQDKLENNQANEIKEIWGKLISLRFNEVNKNIRYKQKLQSILAQSKGQVACKSVLELIDYLKLEISNANSKTSEEMFVSAKPNTNVYHPPKQQNETLYTQLDNKIEVATSKERETLDTKEQEFMKSRLETLKIDPETKLLEAYSMYELLESLEEKKKNYTLLGLGVSGYSEIVRSYGKESSTKILITLGRLLKQYSTLDDIIARFETKSKPNIQFLICLLNGSEQDAKKLSENITQRVDKSIFMYKDKRLQIKLVFDQLQKISHSNIKDMLTQTLGENTQISRGGVLDESY